MFNEIILQLLLKRIRRQKQKNAYKSRLRITRKL
jgi:hypothetical protein